MKASEAQTLKTDQITLAENSMQRKGKTKYCDRGHKRQCYRKGELHSTVYALIKEDQDQEQMFPRDTNEQNKE